MRLVAPALGLAACFAQPALAQSESVEIEVAAEIPSRCGFAASGPQTAVAPTDLENAASISVHVRLDCNSPYALAVTAQRGALVNADTADTSDAAAGYATRKLYGVSVALDTDQGVVRSGRCLSSDLVTGGRCAFAGATVEEGLESGPGISVGRDATITVDWPDQRTQSNRLAPGAYGDTLILVLGARA